MALIHHHQDAPAQAHRQCAEYHILTAFNKVFGYFAGSKAADEAAYYAHDEKKAGMGNGIVQSSGLDNIK
jgi:hypothetical protein